MLMRNIVLAAAGLGALAATACGSEGSSSSSAAGSSSSGASSADIQIGNTSALGQVLTNKSGFTLYYFMPEMGSKLVCDTGTCASTWPLATVSGTPSAASGISGQLTTLMAPGGQSVIVYNGWPLHTFSSDSAPGNTKGQGIAGKWFAATPSLTSSGGGGASASPSASSSYNPY